MRGPPVLQPLQQPQEAAHLPPVRGGGAVGRGGPAADTRRPSDRPPPPPEPKAWRAGRGRRSRRPAAGEAPGRAAGPFAEGPAALGQAGSPAALCRLGRPGRVGRRSERLSNLLGAPREGRVRRGPAWAAPPQAAPRNTEHAPQFWCLWPPGLDLAHRCSLELRCPVCTG